MFAHALYCVECKLWKFNAVFLKITSIEFFILCAYMLFVFEIPKRPSQYFRIAIIGNTLTAAQLGA